MTFFQTLKRKFIGSRAFQGILFGNNSTSYTKWNKAKLIEQGYNRNPVFSAISDRLSDLIADLPIYVDYTDESGRASQATRHPLIDALSRSDQGYHSLMKRTALYLIVTGEAYIQKLMIESDGKKRIVGFVVLPAQYTNPIQGDPMNPVIGYEYIENGRVVFSVDEVIYINNPSISDYLHGNSPGVSIAEVMDMQNAFITWNKNVGVGGGLPSLVIQAPGITPEDSQALKDMWVNINGGAGNAHKPSIMGGDGDMKVLNLNFKPNEAEWAKGIEMATRLIAMRMGYPSELLNDPSGKTYANVTEATKTLYRDVVLPTANRIIAGINRSCSTHYADRPVLVIDKDKIDAMGEDRALLIKRLAEAVNSGIMTANEAREQLGFPAHDSPQASELTNTPAPTSIPAPQSVGNNQQI